MGGRPKSADETADVVQVTDDTRTESFDLVGRRSEVRHHDRHHAGGGRCSDTVMGVFERQAKLRGHAQLLGRLQERIGRGLVAGVVAVRHDLVEPADEVVGFQVTLNGGA